MPKNYPVLDNKPIDQWKVTELKDELRRRKLPIKGKKEELVCRLFEDIETENKAANDEEEEEKSINNEDNDSDNSAEKESVNDGELNNGFNPDDPLDAAEPEKVETDKVESEKVGSDEVEPGKVEQQNVEPVAQDTKAAVVENEKMLVNPTLQDVDAAAASEAVQGVKGDDDNLCQDATSVESAVETACDIVPKESIDTDNHKVIAQPEINAKDLIPELKNEDTALLADDATCNPLQPDNQVPDVSQDLGINVKCESISTDTDSINEKNKLKGNLNADNFHLELEVKPEMVQPSSDGVPPAIGDVYTLGDVKGQDKDQPSLVEMDATYSTTNMELSKKDDIVERESPEKLDLDRSSGDDLMDEDVLENKHVDANAMVEGVGEGVEVKVDAVDEAMFIDAMADGFSPDKKAGLDEEKVIPTSTSEKQKLEDGGVLVDGGFSPDKEGNLTEEKEMITTPSEKRKLEEHDVKANDGSKRLRRWNPETIKVPESQPAKGPPSSTPKDTFKPVSKPIFVRSDSSLSTDSPRERVVPPSLKSATNSLRIDRFLRPFTLKAVQELLAKTGTVSNFWMDQIKTHCYVTYSSAEEAVATRNAVYNLQWPPNGGRFLVAEFVDPQEVKMRLEAPPQAPAPISASPTTPSAPQFHQPQAPKVTPQNALRQKLPPPPPLPLPPPPPLTELPRPREQLAQPLPPPPPPPAQKNPEPSLVTLDDLFKKTKTTPRIYYLPLSEEQVAIKIAAQGKSSAV